MWIVCRRKSTAQYARRYHSRSAYQTMSSNVNREPTAVAQHGMRLYSIYRVRWSTLGWGNEYLRQVSWDTPLGGTMIEDEVLLRDLTMCSADVSSFHHQILQEKRAPFAERLIATKFS